MKGRVDGRDRVLRPVNIGPSRPQSYQHQRPAMVGREPDTIQTVRAGGGCLLLLDQMQLFAEEVMPKIRR